MGVVIYKNSKFIHVNAGGKMPLCGFDKEMLDGLDMFYNGLAEAVTRKSKLQNITIVQAIEAEIEEMNEFISELSNVGNELLNQRLAGIASYALSFYSETLKRHKETKEDINKIIKKVLLETRNFLFEFDKMYEEYFRKTNSPMKELISWINKGEQDAPFRI